MGEMERGGIRLSSWEELVVEEYLAAVESAGVAVVEAR